jgi:beta-lactamase superfamily II metal-dependent hydrolase
VIVRIFDVEHGACAMISGPNNALAVIDCGHNETTGWRPSRYIRHSLQRAQFEYLLITNVDQDHISDLANLLDGGIAVNHFLTNFRVTAETIRLLKQINGPLTNDAEAYLRMRAGATGSVGIPFNQGMGGVLVRSYCNGYPDFTNTNDLSCVYFISYGPFKILFPGDVEKAAWRRLLLDANFVADLRSTTVYVASHHGRESGFCDQVFEHLRPQAVVISDKSISHDTQLVDHHSIVIPGGVRVTKQSGVVEQRHVLTTRRDGDVVFSVQLDGKYTISTTSS